MTDRLTVNLPFRFILFLILTTSCLSNPPRTLDSLSSGGDSKVRVYIDCEDCDINYFRRNIRFIDHVRDPKLAQVHVLITDQQTASGGKEFTVKFLGHRNFSDKNDTLRFVTRYSDTDDQIRRGLTKIIEAGLIPYVARTPQLTNIDFVYDEENAVPAVSALKDPWNFWVFNLGLGGGIESEESRNIFNIATNLDADRVTENWRFRSHADYEYEEENFTEESDGNIKSVLRELEWNTSLVKTLNARWSAGVFNNVDMTTFKNIRLGLEIGPALEYNLFPWKESENRLLSVAYFVGWRYFQYYKETIYNRTRETHPFEALAFRIDVNQPWGFIDTELEGSHYFYDFSKNKLELRIDLSFRLTGGLFFTLEMEGKMIHNQLYLAKGDASLEEILLKRRKLATTYEMTSYFKLSYTFGSIYNNIVNRRLDYD
jgi:hypothetical protein